MKTKFVVLTGGPGAGKTAVLEMAKKRFGLETAVLPEAASMIFSGGFWRLPSASAKMAAQRAIYGVQVEMERLVVEEKRWLRGLCDRGTLDGLAYWPAKEALFWEQIGTTKKKEFRKYAAVIHMRTPEADGGYNYQNTLRVETPEQARLIDERIGEIWAGHSNYIEIPNYPNFLEKAMQALQSIHENLNRGEL